MTEKQKPATSALTELIHHSYQPSAPFSAPQPGVFKASSIFFPNVQAMRSWDWKDKSAFTYGLHGTPTHYILEERIAALEGGKHCLLVTSGLAAIAVVGLALLKAGDHILLPDNVYGPSKGFAESERCRAASDRDSGGASATMPGLDQV